MHDVPSGGILCAFVEHEKYIPDIYIYIFSSQPILGNVGDTWFSCGRNFVVSKKTKPPQGVCSRHSFFFSRLYVYTREKSFFCCLCDRTSTG